MSNEDKKRRTYGDIWNDYIHNAFPKLKAGTPHSKVNGEPWRVWNKEDDHYDWPGDEWGERQLVEKLFDETITSRIDWEPEFFCEIGPGAGRYTDYAMNLYKLCSILSFDVSEEFIRVLKERFPNHVKTGRLKTFLLDDTPLYFYNAMKQEELLGQVDCVFCFDAFVHMDLHTLVVYWLSAARILKPGGILAGNVADACNENGFMKLLYNSPGIFSLRGNAGYQFMWISPDIVDNTLSRMGYDVTFCDGNGRDLSFSAKLVDPDRAKNWLEKSGNEWLPFE